MQWSKTPCFSCEYISICAKNIKNGVLDCQESHILESTLDGQNVPVWTAVTTQGHGVVSVSGEEARGVHEKCGELHTIPAILAAPRANAATAGALSKLGVEARHV